MKDNIPTAEEFLKDAPNNGKYWEDKLIEFAKLHVEAALLKADQKAEVEFDEKAWNNVDDKNFIINSYPLTLIK